MIRGGFAFRGCFKRYEGSHARPFERAVVAAAAYVIGGLGYLAVNRLVGDGPFHNLGLPIDDRIPFVPGFVFAYVLVYVTPAIAAIFLRDRAELYRAFLAFGLNSLICFPVFLFFPVGFPRVLPLPDTIPGRLLSFVHVLDRPGNCFPSHHVSTAFTTFLAVRRQDVRWGAVFGAIAGLIAISTLFVKQHYIVDVPVGIAVSCFTFYLCYSRR